MSEVEQFEDFVAARYAALVRSAYLLVGNRPDAEDLVQTTLARIVPVWPKIKADPERYVRKVLVRESVSRWRRRRWREVGTDAVPEPAAASGLDDAVSQRVALRRALGQLPARQRAVLVLRFYEDLGVTQTAEILGCSEGTVKSQTHDGIARLRALVPDLDEERLPG